MTTLTERPWTEVTRVPRQSMVVESTIGIVGVLAAAVGAWMYYVPADWFLGGLAAGWYLGMFVGAGVLLAIAFGLYARSAFKADGAWTTRVTFATMLSVAAVIGAVAFALIWIL